MATIRKRGTSYELRWSEDGSRRTAALGQVIAKEAEQYRRSKAREVACAKLANVIRLPGRAIVPTLRVFAIDYLAWHAAEYPASTDRIAGLFSKHLLPRFGDHALDAISKSSAERFKSDRAAAGAKSATVSKELRALHAILNRAVFLELIEKNPIRGVRPPRSLDSRPPRWYTTEELSTIYKHSRPLPGDEAARGLPVNSDIDDYAPIWRLLANIGLRRTEAQQLKWKDVTDSQVRIVSSANERTKSGKWRSVPMSEGAREALDTLRAVTGKSVYVLPHREGRSLTRAFGNAVNRAGLDGSLHCLRHSFCAALVSRGVPLRTVQILAGHASFATTEKYAHLAPDYLRNAVAGLDL